MHAFPLVSVPVGMFRDVMHGYFGCGQGARREEGSVPPVRAGHDHGPRLERSLLPEF